MRSGKLYLQIFSAGTKKGLSFITNCFVAALLLHSAAADAQQAKTTNFGFEAKATSVANAASTGSVGPNSQGNYGDPTVVTGHFTADLKNEVRGITEHINVNYILSPAPFTDKLNLTLNTPDPVRFFADIADESGKVVFQWKATEKKHLHEIAMNIANLPSGKYFVNVYWERNSSLIGAIPFEKVSKAKNSARH